MTDNNMAAISGDFLRIDDAPKVFADEDNPADVQSDANATGDVMAGDPFRGVQSDTSMDFGGTPDDQDSVRTASGHTGFLDRILHEQDHSRRRELPPDIAAAIPPVRRPVDTDARTVSPDGLGTTGFTLGNPPNGQRIVWDRPGRTRVVVTNYGPNVLWVSTDGGVGPQSPNAVQIPVNGSREFRVTCELWAGSFAGGTQFDIQDEFYTQRA